ncbi:MAG: trypsin-like peptidase domain-containing protein [Phycisphaeraceae bacterium]
MRETSAAFRAAAARVMPAVVTIETVGGIGLAGGQDKEREKTNAINALSNPGEGPTTGLIVSADGYVLTSTFNFIRKPRIITVTLADGRRKVAELLGRDETRQVCLLKIDGVSDLPVAEPAATGDLRIGQWAIAVGVGYGAEEPAMTAGIISALHRIGGRAVQTDANISPANYGGPLVDIEGRVIGLCTPLNPRTQQAGAGSAWYDSGIGFAVTLTEIEHIMDRMKKGETLKRGLMGVVPSPRISEDGGVKLQQVVPDSPAATAGMATDDRIMTVEGKAVNSPNDLMRVLSRYMAGDKVKLTMRRGEEPAKEMELTLATGPFGEEKTEQGKGGDGP